MRAYTTSATDAYGRLLEGARRSDVGALDERPGAIDVASAQLARQKIEHRRRHLAPALVGMHVDVVDVALAGAGPHLAPDVGDVDGRARAPQDAGRLARLHRQDDGVAAIPLLPAVRLLQIEPRDVALALGRRQRIELALGEQRQRQLARLAHVAREQFAAIEVQGRVAGDARHRALHDVGRGRAQLVERAPRARRRAIAPAGRRLVIGRERPEIDGAHGAGQRRDAAMQAPRRGRVPQAQPRHARSRRPPRPVVVGELEATRARLHGCFDRSERQLLGDAGRLMLGIGAAQKLHRAIAVGDDEIGGDGALPFDADDAEAQKAARVQLGHHLVQER